MGKKSGQLSNAKCRRCGKIAYHMKHKKCSSCGYGETSKMRSYNWQKTNK